MAHKVALNSIFTVDRAIRKRFHYSSMEAQRGLCVVTMSFTIFAFILASAVRQFLPAAPGPAMYRVLCVLVLVILVASLRWVRSSVAFGSVGVAYIVTLVIGLGFDIVSVNNPLWWILPSAMVIPICAAPLWLTPSHYAVGTSAFYGAGWLVIRNVPLSHDAIVVCLLWLVIGMSTSMVFKFGFYRFRFHHFLLEEKLKRLASLDALTGLLNRQGFADGVRDQLAHSSNPVCDASLIILSVDHMTSINEHYGHAVGDQTLRNVAGIVAEYSESHTTGRLDGKKFGIFLSGVSSEEAMQMAYALRRQISRLSRPDGFLTASIGVAASNCDDTVLTIIDRADEALLRAKRMGRDRVVQAKESYSLIPQAIVKQADEVTTSNESALSWGGNTLVSHFQPLFSLSHHKAVGFEGLLRGRSILGELVGPQALFAAAPESGPEALDRVTHRLHLSSAKSHLPEEAWLFVNVLPSTFTAPDYPGALLELVHSAGLSPSNIVVEILESQDGDIHALADAAARYRHAGFLIAIDDFGAGHSNIDRLLKIQPDVVKLDGSLIRAKCRTTFRPLLPNLVSLLHAAGMLVVVEGVETNEELVLAVDANVDLVQGYLLGRPAPNIDQSEEAMRRVERAFEVASETRNAQQDAFESKLKPYLDAMRVASDLFSSNFQGSVDTNLMGLELCSACYLLDESGRPLEHSAMSADNKDAEPRFPPLSNTHEVRWDNRAYFMRALASPGNPVYSEPFLSLTSGRATVAVACATGDHKRRRVLVAKLDWTSPQLPWPNIATA